MAKNTAAIPQGYHTVKYHLASLLAKLGVHSRTEAVTIGLRKGLVPL